MSCKFCQKIWNSEEEYRGRFENHYDETSAIVLEDGKPYLYVPCEDDWYSGTTMQINHCPKCGRKLI